jgi:hypothetical protein
VFTHELVEMISDPEPDSGWTTNKPSPLDEIGDICVLQNGPAGGYAAAAYYSKQLGSCVVPSLGVPRNIDLTEADQQLGRLLVTPGQTVAYGRSDCLSGTYHWTLISQASQATITAGASSYAHPSIAWTINGKDITGPETLHQIPVDNSVDPLSAIATMPPAMADVAVDLPTETQMTITCPPTQAR